MPSCARTKRTLLTWPLASPQHVWEVGNTDDPAIITLKTIMYGVGAAMFISAYFYHASTVGFEAPFWSVVERRGGKLMLEFFICVVLHIPPGCDVVIDMYSLGFTVPAQTHESLLLSPPC